MYWYHNGNKYGPFQAQEDGNPNTGEVVRYFRKLKNMRAIELAKLLNTSERYIYSMESKNRVPDSITRRKAIASILGIPLAFMGLHDVNNITRQNTHNSIDIASYTETLDVLWSSFHSGINPLQLEPLTRHAIDILSNTADKNILGLLARYYRLQSLLERDQRMMKEAIHSIEKAEKIGYEIGDTKLNATNLLTHGRILMEDDNPNEASKFFTVVHNVVNIEMSSLSGTTTIELAMSLSQQTRDKQDRYNVEQLIHTTGTIAHTNLKEDNSYTKLNPGIFHTYTALSYANMGIRHKALNNIEEAVKLVPPEQTRRIALTDIIEAKICFQLQEMYQCIACLERSYTTSKQLNSLYNLHLIKQLKNEIQASKYATMKEVKGMLAYMS